MAAAADPRAKPPAAPSHHLKPWAPPSPPRGHRMPALPAVWSAAAGGGGATRDRRRSSSQRRVGTDGATVENESYDGGLEDLRAKLMGHLRDAADRLRLPQHPTPPPPKALSPTPEPEPEPLVPPPVPSPQPDAAAASRPWNLRERKRRSRGSTASSSAKTWAAEAEARGGERAPFSVALTAEEIEEDMYAVTGARPRRRPRKRPRVVQRQLDSLFPGLWLTEITADAYKVPDV